MSDWMSPTLEKLAPAMLAAQRDLLPALKVATNPHYKSRFADLTECLDAVNAAFHPHGLFVTQLPIPIDNGNAFAVRTVLMHESGQWIASETPIRPDMKDPQKIGAAITYLRRFALAAITGLRQVDDDGETANGRGMGHDYRTNGNGKTTPAPKVDADSPAMRLSSWASKEGHYAKAKAMAQSTYGCVVEALSDEQARTIYKILKDSKLAPARKREPGDDDE